MTDTQTDLLVLGAGPAGLMAAAFAARSGARTLVLGKGPRTGVKILVSGGGHCNLTHDCSVRAMVTAFGHAGAFLEPSLKAFSPRALRRHFERLGVATCVGEEGKVWPVSRRARDVRDALEADALGAGARIRLRSPVQSVIRGKTGFEVESLRERFRCQCLLIATGGLSYPKTGTSGDGYALAGALGHGLVEPVPGLVPLVVEAKWVRGLAGITLPDVRLRFPGDGEEDEGARGPLLFTHMGFSGPVALDLGGRIARHRGRILLGIDWRPDVTPESLDQCLRFRSASGNRTVKRQITRWVPERLAAALLDLAGIPPARPSSNLRQEERRALVHVLKATRVEVAGTRGFSRAEVTAGGIPLPEVDSETLASRRVPGLYLAGEVLDYDGPVGGYNLQAAFSTGKAAGLAMRSG